MTEKTHYRKAFNSPYLSSADITGPTILTIRTVSLETDKSKKSKDSFNTAYFVEREIRKGEPLKPMILNAQNSSTMEKLTSSPFLDDWTGVPVTIYVDNNVRYGADTVRGLRISQEPPRIERPELTPDDVERWTRAVAAYRRDGNLDKVLAHVSISETNQQLVVEQARV